MKYLSILSIFFIYGCSSISYNNSRPDYGTTSYNSEKIFNIKSDSIRIIKPVNLKEEINSSILEGFGNDTIDIYLLK